MFTIVGKRFTKEEFAEYVQVLKMNTAFDPKMVVLHNTGVPTLKDRPNGFSPSSMENLRFYYAEVQKWNGGPHLFVDDLGIWVFNPLDKRGTHSPSWNAHSWGIEMLGTYDVEDFNSGRGLKVQENALSAVATLFDKLDIIPNNDNFKLHKEDPETNHDCPGRHVIKSIFLDKLLKTVAPINEIKIVVYRKGKGQYPEVFTGELRNVSTYARRSDISKFCFSTVFSGEDNFTHLRSAVTATYEVRPNTLQKKVYLVEKG